MKILDVGSSSFTLVKEPEFNRTNRTLKSIGAMHVDDFCCLTVSERGPAHSQPITLLQTAGRLSSFPI